MSSCAISPLRGLGALTFAALCAGCGAQGELALSTGLVDFGLALPGVERQERIELINKRDATMVITGAQSTNPSFSFVFPPRMTLSPLQRRLITVRHVPPVDATEPQEADLQVWSEEGLVAAVHATSVPISPECALPSTLDFGPMTSGETRTLELSLRNSTGRASGAQVELLSTHPGFQTSVGWHSLGPGEVKPLTVTFSAVSQRGYTASLQIKLHPLCASQPVRLIGEVVGSVLTTERGSLNWAVTVGQTEVQAVRLRNVSFSPVELTNLQIREGALVSSAFRLARFPLRVPAGERGADGTISPGEATIELAYTPEGPEQRQATLFAGTDLVLQPTVTIALNGLGLP